MEPVFLRNKRTGEMTEFVLYNEELLKFMEQQMTLCPETKLNDYSMEKLEEEYDYETDDEQVYRAKKHLLTEQKMAVEFFVKEDPIMLVANLKYPQHEH